MAIVKKKEKEGLDMKEVNEVVKLSKKILNIFYIVLIVAVIFVGTLLVKEWGILTFICTLLKILTPLFVGFILAWIFNPLVVKMEKKKIPRVVGTIIVYAVFLLVLYLLISVLIPTVYRQFNELLASLPSIMEKVTTFLNKTLENVGKGSIGLHEIKSNILNVISHITEGIKEGLPDMILGAVGSIFSGAFTFLMSLVIGFYMLFDFNSITKHFNKLIPVKYRYEVRSLMSTIGTELRKYVNGTLFVASMVFVGCALGFWITGLEAPLLFGLFCGITDLIPYIGPYIGGIAAVVVGLSQSFTTGIICLIIIIVVQQLEGMVLQPIVMSKAMKLHPITIIIGLIIFEHFFGIIGMIFATPAIAFLKIVYRFFAHKFGWFQNNNAIEMDEEIIIEK